MRITYCAIGSRGDIQPLLALAIEARRRGCRPLLCAPPNYQSWIESHGVDFAPFGIDYRAYLEEHPDNISGNPWAVYKGVRKFFDKHLTLQFEQLLAAAEGSACIVFSGMAFVAPSVAELLKVPALAVVFSSCMLPSKLHPPAIIPHQTFPGWLNGLMWSINHFAANRVVNPGLNFCRRRAGLAPTKFSTQFYQQSIFSIAADPALLPADPCWNPKHKISNFIYHKEHDILDPDLDSWLREGDAPIYIGFGSMHGKHVDRMTKVVAEALNMVGQRCIVAAGWGALRPRDLPTGSRIVASLPHQRVFPRVACVVHHGGSGTMANALRAGKPQVIVPLLLDQYYHAHRLHQAGLVPVPMPMERISAEELARQIVRAQATSPVLLESTAARLRKSNSVRVITEQIFELCGLDEGFSRASVSERALAGN